MGKIQIGDIVGSIYKVIDNNFIKEGNKNKSCIVRCINCGQKLTFNYGIVSEWINKNTVKKCMNCEIQSYIGKEFGRLKVIRYVGKVGKASKHDAFECECSCGNLKHPIVQKHDLDSEHTQSCGCYHKERAKEAKTTHGLRYTRIYSIWQDMIRRCEDPRRIKDYPNYGGRGIKVCNEWHNVEVFVKWALSHGYTDKLTIDRIDHNGNYEPSNCRFVAEFIQATNKTDNIYVEYNGTTYPLADLVRMFELNYKSTIEGIVRHGKTIYDFVEPGQLIPALSYDKDFIPVHFYNSNKDYLKIQEERERSNLPSLLSYDNNPNNRNR